ncbi:MAG TPA: DUF167 domain-containing protein [Candidatus Limnocylindrales bacterium]
MVAADPDAAAGRGHAARPVPLTTRVIFTARVTPRAGVDTIDGAGESGELRLRVRATPADGAANEAVRRTIAAALHVAPSRVVITAGATSRTKRIAIDDCEAQTLEARWPGLLTRTG